jgi:dCTP deaminase
MSFLSKRELAGLLPYNNCIVPYNPSRLMEVAYELALGDQVYLTDSKDGKRELLGGTNTQVIINQGQFALLLTEETVHIPDNKIAFISIKFSEKIKGLINVSGFHIDPGFHGKIIFSVYNAGPVPIIMDKGQPYFMIWFSKLTSRVAVPYNGTHQAQSQITAATIQKLKGELASPSDLLKKLNKQNEVIKSNDWLLKSLVVTFAGAFLAFLVSLFTNSLADKRHLKSIKEEVAEYVDSAATRIQLNRAMISKIDSIVNSRINIIDASKAAGARSLSKDTLGPLYFLSNNMARGARP